MLPRRAKPSTQSFWPYRTERNLQLNQKDFTALSEIFKWIWLDFSLRAKPSILTGWKNRFERNLHRTWMDFFKISEL